MVIYLLGICMLGTGVSDGGSRYCDSWLHRSKWKYWSHRETDHDLPAGYRSVLKTALPMIFVKGGRQCLV